MSVVFGTLSDWLLSKRYLKIPIAAKLFEVIGLGIPALALGMMGFFTEDFGICLAILTIGFGMRGAIYSGHIKSVQLLSQNFTGKMHIMTPSRVPSMRVMHRFQLVHTVPLL